jgi:hypothetical protein
LFKLDGINFQNYWGYILRAVIGNKLAKVERIKGPMTKMLN